MKTFFDLETDGLDTATCQITQAAVINQDGKTLFCKCYGIMQNRYQPAALSQEGLDYNGTSDWQRDNLPCFAPEDFAFMLSLMAVSSEVWAHNVAYDSAVLRTYASRFSAESIDLAHINFKCTMALGCEKLGFKGQTRMKLPTLKLDSVAHDALSDTQNAWLLWQKCNGFGQWNLSSEPNLNF
jgi:hypothetical protein